MAYETSYESGRQPFQPDKKRGKWSNPSDFIYAGMSLAFRFDVLSMTWLYTMNSGLLIFTPIYLLSMVIYIVPLIVIQSFMGQFSSSGFISAFRLSPMFKGIGYVTLVMNICVLSYHSIFAIVPLLYMFASMQPTLPWSCEAFKKWAQNLTEQEEINLCNINLGNETLEGSGESGSTNETENREFINHHIPSVLYFKSLFNDLELFGYENVDYSMSWQLILCALLVWALIALLVYKYFKTETIGILIRYSVWTVLVLMAFFLGLFSFLPGAKHIYHFAFFEVSWRELFRGLWIIPLYGLSAFGPGWGLLLTLSSHNQFKTNIIKSSWLIGLGQFVILVGMDLLINITEGYFNELTDGNYYPQMELVWILILSAGSAMVHMPWANLWLILFYFMMFLSTMVLLIIQLKCILTTIYDEFLFVREKKPQVALFLVAFMAVVSLYFTSNHGITFNTVLAVDAFITQNAINLLLILIVAWIYGRVRLQRDVAFMTNQRFSTWSINILRFVTPLGMVLALIGGFFISDHNHSTATVFIDVLAVLFIAIPWISIPGYAIYQMSRSMGTIKTRFLRCCRATDWFPVEADERRKYEEALGNQEITHTFRQLRDVDDLE